MALKQSTYFKAIEVTHLITMGGKINSWRTAVSNLGLLNSILRSKRSPSKKNSFNDKFFAELAVLDGWSESNFSYHVSKNFHLEKFKNSFCCTKSCLRNKVKTCVYP